jgi:hypothetical protein
VASAASPGLDTTASPGGGVGSTLTDSATLSGGYFPTGIVTFTLTDPGGSVVDTEITSVDGNATYTTPNGFTLFRGSAAGTYIWTASYTGDASNNDEISSLGPVSVGSVGSVPEPSTWMMGLGFAGLGFVAFRRSEKGDASTVLV